MEDVTKLKISDEEKARLLIKNLNNRPNAMATYGKAKMSSTEAKDIFDKQFEFLTERFNNMTDSVAAVDNKLDEFGRVIAGVGDRLDEQDKVIGDVSSALDELHAYAVALAGGSV